MQHITISDSATRYTRITKRKAKQRIDAGKPVYLIAHKMRPGFPFSMGMTVHPNDERFGARDFDSMLANFAYYNCSHETGYYPAFYIESELDGTERY